MKLQALACALLLFAGCSDEKSDYDTVTTGSRVASESAPMAAPPPPVAGVASFDGGAGEEAQAPKLAYTHTLSMEMAATQVKPRFDRAREACAAVPNNGCSIVYASIQVGNEQTGALPYASFTVRLAHDHVAPFEAGVLSPFEGEPEGEPILRERTTNAEDLTYAILDVDRRLAQASDYRDRLTALAQRPDAKIEELIQIEAKISETQSMIEAYTAEQRGLNQRVDTEVMTIYLSATPTFAEASSPLAEAWRNAGRVLGESAAQAFTFVISVLPWLPLIALGLWLIAWLWRIVRGRRWRRSEAAAASVASSS